MKHRDFIRIKADEVGWGQKLALVRNRGRLDNGSCRPEPKRYSISLQT